MADDPQQAYTEDSAEYLDDWARKLAEATPQAELRLLQTRYLLQARDLKLSGEDRRFAQSRAEVLTPFVK